jgi:hypothetical protein
MFFLLGCAIFSYSLGFLAYIEAQKLSLLAMLIPPFMLLLILKVCGIIRGRKSGNIILNCKFKEKFV